MESSEEPQAFCYECANPLDDEYDYSCIDCGRLACDNHFVTCQDCDFTACSMCMIPHWNEHDEPHTSDMDMSAIGVTANAAENQALLVIQHTLLQLADDVKQIVNRLDRLIDSVDRLSE